MLLSSKTLSDDCRLDWLRLIRSDRVGPITFHKLLARYGSAAAALDALPELTRKGRRTASAKIASRSAAERELAAHEDLGAKLIAWGEPGYPPRLAAIEDAPPLLSVLGRIELLGKKTFAIVGARNASTNGRRFAQSIATDLADGGLMIASGMARGIDASAHLGAIDKGTLAVLGGGVDVIYPKENTDLYHRIAEQGVVVSEPPPGTRPEARHFPRRNRIISGVSRGVLVIEASLRSGSLITSRMALEQGREVFAVPGSALDPRARGTNDLIRQGATLTERAEDVFEALNGCCAGFPTPPPTHEEFDHQAVSDNEIPTSARQEVENRLSPTPSHIDELIRETHYPAAAVATILLELELAGRLERHPGNRVSLIAEP